MMQSGPYRLGTPSIGRAEAEMICRLLRDRSGIAIPPEKTSFLEQRLGRRMRDSGHADIHSYLATLSGPDGATEAQRMVEALTTHTTGFFRDASQFNWLRDDGLPALVGAGAGIDRPLLVWSAAASTGAEMWTAAMVVDRFVQSRRPGLQWSVAGSDVSRRILRRASRAVFDADEIADLPEDFRSEYLLRAKGETRSRALYRIAPELRRRARLYWANLAEGGPPLQDEADVVFLRNVLIYFDSDATEAALTSVLSQLKPGGFLLTGHTECLNPLPPGLTQISSSIFRKAGS